MFSIHQDAELPPLEAGHLDGKFDHAKAVQEASMAIPGTVPGAAPGKGPGAPEQPVRARDLRLKGADAMIYLCAARLGLRPVVLRLVWDECNQVRRSEQIRAKQKNPKHAATSMMRHVQNRVIFALGELIYIRVCTYNGSW